MVPMTLTELAAAHTLSYQTLDNWVRLGKIPAVGSRTQKRGFGRPERLYDPAVVGEMIATRTPPDGWATLRDAAKAKGWCWNWAYTLYEQGRLTTCRRNGRIYVDPASLADVAPPPGKRHKLVVKNFRVPSEKGEAGDGYGKEVPFGPSGLKLYAADLEFLDRVRARRLARAGREVG